MADNENEDEDEKIEEEEASKGSQESRSWWQETIRELTLTGLATFFMTEDSVRGYLKDKKFPKELVGLFLEGVNKRKDDFYGLMAKEFGRVLGKVDISNEVGKFLEKHKIHFEAKISFEKKAEHKHALKETKEEG